MVNPEDVPQNDRFRLRRPMLWSFGFMAQVSIAAIWVLELSFAFWRLATMESFSLERTQISGIIFVALLCWVVARRMYTHLQPIDPIVLGAETIALPRGTRALGTETIDYLDLLSVSLTGLRPMRRMVVESSVRAFVYDERDFARAGAFDELHHRLMLRIRQHPDAPTIQNKMSRHSERLQLALERNPYGTQVMVALLIIGFLVSNLTPIASPLDLLRWGALSPSLLLQGEVYRLFSSLFLHWEVSGFGIAHVSLTILGLLVFGVVLERLLGHFRFLLIATGAALTAGLSTLITQDPIFYGATSIVFGLGGAVLLLQQHPQFPPAFKQGFGGWLMPTILAAAILLFPGLALIPHATALISGMGLCWVFSRDAGYFPLKRLGTSVQNLGGSVSIGMAFISSFMLALVLGRDPSLETRRGWIEIMFEHPIASGDLANSLAWSVAMMPEAEAKVLARADALLKPHIERSPKAFVWIDTLAALRYRQGMADNAVVLERQAIEQQAQIPKWLNVKISAESLRQPWLDYAAPLSVYLTQGGAEPTQDLTLMSDGQRLVLAPNGLLDPEKIIYVVALDDDRPVLLIQALGAAFAGGAPVEFQLPFESEVPADVDAQVFVFDDLEGMPVTLMEDGWFMWELPQTRIMKLTRSVTGLPKAQSSDS